MAPTTSQAQRAELHKTIWRIANDLRGSITGWDFKGYVLGMLFYRFISENLAAYVDAGERKAGDANFNYRSLADADAEFGRKETVAEKGFYMLPSELFANVRARAAQDANLNETLAHVFANIEGSALGTESEDDLKGLFDDLEVNSSKLGNTVAQRNAQLVKLLDAIGDLPLGDLQDNNIDLFGDAYEYLMTMYAANAGRSGGEFFTPQEVSELLARITVVGKTSVNKVYDPACGSGSLLLKFAKVLGKDNVRQGFYGQEKELSTYNLARINMFLHDINYDKFHIAHGDTLTDPAHWDDEPFDAIVSNPPYSIKWDGDANPLMINDPRFAPAGVLAPKSKADLAFTMHMLSWLAVDGTAAIVEFPGVLYRGGAEAKIRKYLIDNNYVDTVIQLPPDLFFGTTIATCIILLKKSKNDNSVLFVDASAEFNRDGNKNKLRPANQERILGLLAARTNEGHLAKLVPNEAIATNDYNIAVSPYLEPEDTREAIDISRLNAQIARIVTCQAELRTSIDELVADLESNRHAEGVEAKGHAKAGWESVKIGDVARIEKGLTAIQKAVPGKYPLVATSQDLRSSSSYDFDAEAVCVPLVSSKGHGVASISRLYYQSGKFALGNILCAIIPNDSSALSAEFLYHCLQARKDTLLVPLMRGGANVSLTVHSLKSVQIYVPCIEEQLRIVEALRALSLLVDDSTFGLPAELTARRKQYEYYRDKLLTFEELSA